MITPLDRPQDRPESALTVPERATAVEVAGAPDRRRRVTLPIAGTTRTGYGSACGQFIGSGDRSEWWLRVG